MKTQEILKELDDLKKQADVLYAHIDKVKSSASNVAAARLSRAITNIQYAIDAYVPVEQKEETA